MRRQSSIDLKLIQSESDSDSDGCKLVSVWSGSDCLATRRSLATPGNCCLPESAPAGQAGHCQAAPGGSSGHPLAAPGASPPARCLCPVSLPAITDSGQLVGRAGTSRLATYTTVQWPLIPSGSGHLPLGPGSDYPGAVSQFHHAAFQLT